MAATKENLYRLHSVGVVVTAEFHNPSVLNRDFLVSKRIVPEDWEVTEGFTTPGLSVLSYDNGIQWTLDQSKGSQLSVTWPALKEMLQTVFGRPLDDGPVGRPL